MTALVVLAEAAGGGAGTMLVGVLTGKVAFAKRTPRPPRQFCTCGHGRGTHTDQGCHYSESERVKIRDKSTYTLNAYGDSELAKADIEWQMVEYPCDCKRYDGPIPVDEYVAGFTRTL